MPLKYSLAFCLAAALLPSAAWAGQTVKGVVELFTSQGCSSCPPADEALRKMIENGDVIGLAYHVDYWNYLGWADSLASKDNTRRQYRYARTLGRNNVYTPQAIVNGRDHLHGADLPGIYHRMEAFSATGEGLRVPVYLQPSPGGIDVEIGGGTGKADIVVASFTREQVVSVEKGENQGKIISYWHSVYDLQTIGSWDGTPVKARLPAGTLARAGAKGGRAVLLQTVNGNGDPAAIIGADMVILPDN